MPVVGTDNEIFLEGNQDRLLGLAAELVRLKSW